MIQHGIILHNLMESMMKKHKHADLIKTWADGSQIQYWSTEHDGWVDIDSPCWCDDTDYRIKPKPSYIKLIDLDRVGLNGINVLYTPDKKLCAKILDIEFKSGYANMTILAKIDLDNGEQRLILINRNSGSFRFMDDGLYYTGTPDRYFVYYEQD
jgi:hypothetical protein